MIIIIRSNLLLDQIYTTKALLLDQMYTTNELCQTKWFLMILFKTNREVVLILTNVIFLNFHQNVENLNKIYAYVNFSQ